MSLAAQVRGPVLGRADPGYDEECGGFQTVDPHRPDVVVGATCEADVVAAVRHAAGHGMRVAVQATGHGLRAPLRDGLLVSTRRMAGVSVDPSTRTARVQAGVRSGALVAEAAPHGLTPLAGSSPDVGVVGYALGGGLPVLGRAFGWACDRVRSVEVVTPDGALRHVTAANDPDRFRAVCGGRDAVGIVVAIEVELLARDRLFGGGRYYDGRHAPELLDDWRAWTTTVPDAMTSSIAFVPLPDVPALPPPLRGRHVAHVRFAHAGPAEEGAQVVAGLGFDAPPLLDTLGELPASEIAAIYAEPRGPMGYAGVNALVDGLDPAAGRRLLELTGPGSDEPGILEVRHLGGALAARSAAVSAAPHRDAAYLVDALSRLAGPEDRARTVPLRRAIDETLAPRRLGRSLNFTYGPGD